ncbi:MAG: hypothetical protein ACKVKL_07490 [Pseudomonadales bacterium]|jgi:hypothetical protein
MSPNRVVSVGSPVCKSGHRIIQAPLAGTALEVTKACPFIDAVSLLAVLRLIQM